MKIILAAVGFITGDIDYNKNIIIKMIKENSNQVDFILFGESFLQGFDSLKWDFEIDKTIALSIDSNTLKEIQTISKEYSCGVSFGYFELADDSIYSSQIVIDKNGNIIHNYRRVSPGWRVDNTDCRYKEGLDFSCFNYDNKRILIGLCGDLWYTDNIKRISEIKPDIIFWPVYTDFNYKTWNDSEKYEYAKQVESLYIPTLYVNSFCLDKVDDEIARGGAALFDSGEIVKEIPACRENIMIIEI